MSETKNATIGDGQATATILDDDGPAAPMLSINNASISEGNTGTKTVTLTVRLSQTRTTGTTVMWATANGTATAGSDYTSASGTATIAAGATTATVQITVRGDTTTEPNETFNVRLSAPSAGVTIADNTGVVTITNDD